MLPIVPREIEHPEPILVGRLMMKSRSQIAIELDYQLPAIDGTLQKLVQEGKITREKPEKGPFMYTIGR